MVQFTHPGIIRLRPAPDPDFGPGPRLSGVGSNYHGTPRKCQV